MERLNSKLYDKYRNVKKRKLSEAVAGSAKLQAELEKYLSVVESMVEELQNEKNLLLDQISSMEDRQAEYQQSLMEETRKVKELSGEIEGLRNQVSAQDQCNTKTGGMEIVSVETPNRIPEAGSGDTGEPMVPNSTNRPNKLQHKVSDANQHGDRQDELLRPYCCRRNLSTSGDGNELDCAKCVYQMLVESLVGMKFSVEGGTDAFCFSVTHQSSGYSFTLTWSAKRDEEGELFYRVSSLGTIERVALEWMKEDLVFGAAMCPVFFQRICRVIGGGL